MGITLTRRERDEIAVGGCVGSCPNQNCLSVCLGRSGRPRRPGYLVGRLIFYSKYAAGAHIMVAHATRDTIAGTALCHRHIDRTKAP